MRLALFLALIAGAAAASSGDAWEEFRKTVETACAALAPSTGTVMIDVNPFGSQSYGAAVVSVTTVAGTDRMICIFDKATGEAELTAAFPG